MGLLRYGLVFLSALALSAAVAGTAGCAADTTATPSCTVTPFIAPTAVTLDHTLAGNSQSFTTGYRYTGSCAISDIAVQYYWAVSDPIDATVSTTGAVSCVNASAAPITVYSTLQTYSGNPPVASYTPTNLPTATLTCK